jgi:hypothetical protein
MRLTLLLSHAKGEKGLRGVLNPNRSTDLEARSALDRHLLTHPSLLPSRAQPFLLDATEAICSSSEERVQRSHPPRSSSYHARRISRDVVLLLPTAAFAAAASPTVPAATTPIFLPTSSTAAATASAILLPIPLPFVLFYPPEACPSASPLYAVSSVGGGPDVWAA